MNNNLEIYKKVLGEIYTSFETINNLKILCDDYGSRWPGTPENRLAANFILNKFEEYELYNPHLEAFKFPGWIRGSSKLEILSPIKKNIPCLALPYSIDGEIEGKLVNLGDGPVNIYEQKKNEINGNIVMVKWSTSWC
jgi:Iap family predicted aminopeptidase